MRQLPMPMYLQPYPSPSLDPQAHPNPIQPPGFKVFMGHPNPIRPGGQAAPAAPAAPAGPDIQVGADGRLTGIDGVLDQVSEAVVRSVARNLLPVLQNDKAMQETIGEAAGRAIGRELKPVLWTGVGVLGFMALLSLLRETNKQPRCSSVEK